MGCGTGAAGASKWRQEREREGGGGGGRREDGTVRGSQSTRMGEGGEIKPLAPVAV